jgi:ferritin-like metal-binding protein YciE
MFRDELADLYDAEQQILKALPKMIAATTASELKNALEQHRQATEGQVKRLEQIFESEGKPAPKKCKGMAGVLAEGDEILEENYEGEVRDAGIIGAAQRVEHYEIAAYGTARAFAEQLGKDDAVQLLQETLDEEKEADQLLTEIAEGAINVEAATEERDGEQPEKHSRRSRTKAANGGRARRKTVRRRRSTSSSRR